MTVNNTSLGWEGQDELDVGFGEEADESLPVREDPLPNWARIAKKLIPGRTMCSRLPGLPGSQGYLGQIIPHQGALWQVKMTTLLDDGTVLIWAFPPKEQT